MNANELLLGNYVNYLGIPTRVTSLSGTDKFYIATFTSGIFHESNYNPIPLTEKWLLDFGFNDRSKPLNNGMSLEIEILVKMKIAWYRQDNRLRFQTIENGFILKYINYVHELQNLYFSLTGNHLRLVEPN